MKKFTLLAFLGVLSLTLVMPSCKKDKDNSVKNEFVLDGKSYDLDKGFLIDFGDNGNGSFDFDVVLSSSTINYSDATGYFNGVGDFIYLDLNSSSDAGLVSGTYNFSSNRDVFSFVDGQVAIGYDIGTLTGEDFEVNGGTVEVEVNGNEVTIDCNLTLSGGGTVEGNYKGTLRKI